MSSQPAVLALANGRLFRGRSFGHQGTVVGEVVFNTGLTGYQEILTDPSYRRQIVAMTNPQIGNTGVNAEDPESDRIWLRGFIVRELSPVASSWRSTRGLADYLAEQRVVGIRDLDTRALTMELRRHGSLGGVISSGDRAAEGLVEMARGEGSLVGRDLVAEVTCGESYDWTDADERWLGAPEPARFDVVAYDFGIKRSILRLLAHHGVRVHVVPAATPAEEVLARGPDGVFLSNGPGDPEPLGTIVGEIAKLIGRVPMFGICLGHQLAALALGAKTFKLKFGHHGSNQPVREVRSGRVEITTQNHGFAVDPDSLPAAVEPTHWNLNDQTLEGFHHREVPLIAVQHHPEAAPGPRDARHMFSGFTAMMAGYDGEDETAPAGDNHAS